MNRAKNRFRSRVALLICAVNLSACTHTHGYALGPYPQIGPGRLFRHVRSQVEAVSQTTDFAVTEVDRGVGRIQGAFRERGAPVLIYVTRDGWVQIQSELDGHPGSTRTQGGYAHHYEDFVRRLGLRIETSPLHYGVTEVAVEPYQVGGNLRDLDTAPVDGWRSGSGEMPRRWLGATREADHRLLLASLLLGLAGYGVSGAIAGLEAGSGGGCRYEYGMWHLVPVAGALAGLGLNAQCDGVDVGLALYDLASGLAQLLSLSLVVAATAVGNEVNASERFVLTVGGTGAEVEARF